MPPTDGSHWAKLFWYAPVLYAIAPLASKYAGPTGISSDSVVGVSWPLSPPPPGLSSLLPPAPFSLPGSNQSVNKNSPPTTTAAPAAAKEIVWADDNPLNNPPLSSGFVCDSYRLICRSQSDASAPYICRIWAARISLFINAVQTKDNPVLST